jgi:glycosyltransferase involved in cell wall biosynthesis
MKILQITYIYPPESNITDGITYVAYNISKELSRRGHEVTVYTSDILNLYDNESRSAIDNMIIDNVDVHYFRCLVGRKTFFVTPKIIHSLKKNINKFDIIHLHDVRTFQAIATYPFARTKKIPYIFQSHGAFFHPLPTSNINKIGRLFLDKTIGERIVKNAKKIITTSKTESETYYKWGISKDKILTIPNGIDLSKYKNLPPKESFKKKYGIEDNKKIVLYLARMHWVKGPDVLVKAFALLKKNIGLNKVILVLAGPDDGFLSTIESLVARLGLNESVLLTGPLYGTDKLAAYVDADVYVLPSRYEIFGISLLEACACGVPVVVSRVGGLRDLVIDGVTGILFEPCDVKQLGYAIATLLNDKRAREMGLRAKRYVKENFSIEKVVDRLEILYDTIVSSKVR